MSVPGGPADDSIAAIAREIADDAVRLAKAEIDLAKAQAIASLKRFAVAIGLFAGAGLFLLFAVIFMLGSVPTALAGRLFSGWLWWLLFGVLFLVAGTVVGYAGFRSLRRGIGRGRELVGEVKEDVAWLKRLAKRNASGS